MYIKKTFSGGIPLKPDKQQTGTLVSEPLPPPPRVFIPLLQHFGEPARPTVKPGDHVGIGQIIGQAPGNNSCAIHASISGTVLSVAPDPYSSNKDVFSVSIENNYAEEYAFPIPYDKPWQESEPLELIEKIKLGGIVELSGTPLPVYRKLVEAIETSVETLIINAIEDDPLCAATTRYAIEYTEQALLGALIVQKITAARQCIIAVAHTSNDAIQALSTACDKEEYKTITLQTFKAKYPLHEEVLLIQACSSKKNTPAPSLSSAGEIVLNIGTLAAIANAVVSCAPFTERIITAAGPAAQTPKNLRVRIGTPVIDILEACQMTRAKKIVLGTLLGGATLIEQSAPVTRVTASVLGFFEPVDASNKKSPCTRCGRCLEVCPIGIAPLSIMQNIRNNDLESALQLHIMHCIECGCCGYSCPSKINLLHYLIWGKKQIIQHRSTQC